MVDLTTTPRLYTYLLPAARAFIDVLLENRPQLAENVLQVHLVSQHFLCIFPSNNYRKSMY